MKIRRREQPFWRERDPKPDPRDAAVHAQVSNDSSIEHLARPRYDRSVRSTHGNFAGIPMRESAAGPVLAQAQVCARLHVSRITLWRMVKSGKFPAPMDIGRRRALWRGLEVNAWCKTNAAHFEKRLNYLQAHIASAVR